MSHFIIPDDKDENWKNSEVMKNFVDLMRKQAAESPEVVDSTEVLEVFAEDEGEEEDFGILDIETQSTRAKLEDTLNSLNKIAVESAKYGNETATYQIELAASEVKGLLNKLDEGDE